MTTGRENKCDLKRSPRIVANSTTHMCTVSKTFAVLVLIASNSIHCGHLNRIQCCILVLPKTRRILLLM